MSENFSSVITDDDLPPFSSVITADDLMQYLLSVQYGPKGMAIIHLPCIASVEEIATVLTKVEVPWEFEISDGRSGAAAITVLTMPYNNFQLYVLVRVYFLNGDTDLFKPYVVVIDNGYDQLTFRLMTLPLNWCSPTIRLYDGDYMRVEYDGGKPLLCCFNDLLKDCTKESEWFISPKNEISQQIDYFALDYRFPNDCMLLFTHSRHVQSDMLVIPKNKVFKSSRVEIQCCLDNRKFFGFQSKIGTNRDSRVVCIPVDLQDRVDIDQLCTAKQIQFVCDDLGINATFSTSGLSECILSVNRAIPLWSTRPIW